MKPQIDIAELLPGIGDIFGELDIDDRNARERNRPNAVFVGGGRMDVLIFGDRLLDRPGDELLYFLGGRAGPPAGRDRDAHRDVWIFALGHREIPVYTPR